jgi:hypothetical protein
MHFMESSMGMVPWRFPRGSKFVNDRNDPVARDPTKITPISHYNNGPMLWHLRRAAPALAAILLAISGCSSAAAGDGGVSPSSGKGTHSAGGGGASDAGTGANASGGAAGSAPHGGGSSAQDRDGGAAASSGTGGNTGAAGANASAVCKRGIAANTAPGPAFFPAIGWWYDWSMQKSGTDVGIEFVPMMWGKSSVNTAIPSGSKYLLTFNEPNFHAQSNLTPQQAASYWPTIEKAANAAQVPIVSPAMNFCGPADQCNGTSPYQYLKDFFAACTNCKVDYVAIHWYNCDLPSLEDYIETGGSLEGFEQFGKPIWLTEFSCNGSASEADQEKYMRAAIPYLEGNPNVYRYSWFSAGPIPNAQLLSSDGSPTALGKVYIDLAGACK